MNIKYGIVHFWTFLLWKRRSCLGAHFIMVWDFIISHYSYASKRNVSNVDHTIHRRNQRLLLQTVGGSHFSLRVHLSVDWMLGPKRRRFVGRARWLTNSPHIQCFSIFYSEIQKLCTCRFLQTSTWFFSLFLNPSWFSLSKPLIFFLIFFLLLNFCLYNYFELFSLPFSFRL